MKTFLFPGKGLESLDDEIYSYVESEALNSINVEIEWSSSLQKNINATKKFLGSRAENNSIFIGHSWGAVLALVNSEQFPVNHLILCSLSPDFREDYEKMTQFRKFITKKFSTSKNEKPSYPELGNTDVTFLYGSKEYYGYFNISSLGYGRELREKFRKNNCQRLKT